MMNVIGSIDYIHQIKCQNARSAETVVVAGVKSSIPAT